MEEGSITEEQISAEFNEIDPNDDSGSILRTITEFSLTDTKGRIVSIEDIGNGKIGTLHGYILEPYDETWRNEILNTVITSKQQVPVSKEDFAVVLPGPTKRAKATKVQKGIILDPPIIEEDIEEKQVFLPTEELKLNREALQIGDVIDGYCTKTFHWYEAKILDIEPGPTGQLRLHFKGWASKYDEWIARDSERIAKQGSSSQLMYEAAKKASDMIPWYCQDDLIAKVSSKLSMPVPIRKRVKVTISTIDDWCIDYSYANPNLWLISTSGVWYRIAGVFCEGGHRGRPADHYKPFFTTSFERFLCATHIAMIILDFLPSNLKLSVKDVAEEVSARTKGEISEKTMLVNYKLLYDQISNLTAPVDWDKKIKISKCLFLTQLVKNGEIYQNSGGRFGLSSSYISPETADYGATEKYVERRGRKRKVPLDGDGVAITSPGGTGGGEGGNIEDWDDDDFDEPISRGPPLPETIQELPGWRAYYQGIEALDYITTDEENKSNAFMNAYLSQFKAPYDDSQYFTMMFLASKIFPPHPKPSNPTAKPFLCPTRSLGSFLHSWVTLINLKTQLGLPFVSVSFLDECLFSPLITWHRDTVTGTDTEFPIVDTTETTLRRAQKSKRGLVTGGVHPMMKEIMTALIAVLVVDEHTKRPLNTFPITVLPTESTSSGLEDTGTSVDLNRDSTGPSSGVEPESSQSDEMDVVVAVNDTDNIPSDVAGTVESKSESPDQESVTNFGDKNICLLNNTINQILATTTSTTSTATGSDSTFPASLKALHPFLSFGETWYEVLRSYIASKEKESAPELWDPLAACEEVLLMLIADPKSQPFRKPIDAQAEGLTDYHIIVTRPIDLGTILKQLRSGYYDSIDVSVDSSLSFLSTISNSADVIATSATSDIKPTTPTSKGNNHNCQFTVGDTLDFYHSQACRWYESRVTEVDFDFSPPRITLRPIRWGKGQEESVPVDSNRIAPLGHYSRYVKKRIEKPGLETTNFSWGSPTSKILATSPTTCPSSPGAQSSITQSNKYSTTTTGINSSNKKRSSIGSSTNHSIRKLYSYEQVARDVQRVWNNCRQYIGHQSGAVAGMENPFLEAVNHLETLWNELYSRHVLKLIETKKKLIKKKQESLSVLSKGLMDLAPVSNTMSLSDITSLTTKPTVSSIETNEAALELPHNRDVTSEHHVSWSHCSSVLSLWEYIDLPANTRLNLLSWLCFEIMDTEYISNFMSNLTAFKIPITRTYKTGDEDGSDDDAIGAASSLTPGKSKLPIIKKRMSSSSLVGSSNTTLSEGVSDENADFGYSVMRWTGLGKDRDGRLYWVFNAPDINKIESKDESGVSSVLDEIRENRLYCEDVATGDWIIYDRVDDINFLLAWLTDKTICESQLQKALITWMKASEIPITVTPQSTMVKRSKKSMSADEANLGESENIQLLTRNKSAGAGAESVDYSGHWMTKSTHAVAVLVDIYLVDGITSPGIGMLRADNAMFVTGFRRDGNNRSLGEEAGLRVGDMIVAVNGRAVAGNIDVIRDTMAAILEPTKASESTQDEETTTGTTIQKKSTAGSTEKVKSRKSNTTASNGTDNNESVTGSVNQIYNTVFETTPRLQVLVLRRTDPMSFSGFRELSNREPTIKSSWIEFLAQRNAYLSLTVSDDNCGDLIKSTVGSLSEAYPTNSVTVKSQSTTTSRRRAAAAAEAEAKAIARADAESAANTAAAAATAKTAFLSSKLPSTDLLNPMTDRAYYAGSLVGGLLDLLMRTNHPYAVPDEWTDRRNEWIEKLHHCMAEINKIYSLIRVYKYFMQIPLDSFRAVDKSKLASKKSQGHQYFKHLRDNLHQARLQLLSTERACMLEFEQILYLGGNILTSEWLDNRTRQKWHSLCQQPLSTTAQVSLVCFQLISAVDFKRLASANVSMTRKKWFETGVAKNYLFYSGSANSNTTTATTTATSIVKASASSSSTSLTKKELKAQQSQQQVVRTSQEEDELTQLSIPIEGSVVIYYGDGHMEAYQRGQSKQLPKMWGESAKPYSGHIFLCLVRSVRVLLCGSLESGRYFPFAQVDLIVIDKSAYASSPRIIKTAPSDHAGLTYRLVNRLINTLEHCPESVPFLTAVNVSDHPDYLKIVKKPTDLSLIKKKARNGDYSTCEQFKSDITLLRDNCRKYCSELYPELVTYADQLYEEFSRLYDMLVSELLLLPSGNHVKDESTSFSNSSNNNIDMISKVSSTTSNATVSESTGISFKFPAKIITEKFANAIRVAPTGFAVRGIFKPKGTLPTSMEPIGGLSAAATSSFTVCVRLGEGSSSLEASPFLIEIDLYKRLCESVEISSHVILKSSIALPHLCSDTVQAAPFPRVGTLTSITKELIPSDFIPWRALRVEWADGSDDCTDINPWDAQIPSSSTHPSATAVGDLNESVTDVRIAGAKSKGR